MKSRILKPIIKGSQMKKRFFIPIIYTLCALCFAGNVFSATTDWTLIKEKKGVQLYERDVADSKYDEYKAVTICNASVEALLEVLIDVANYPKWLPECVESERLKMFDKDPIQGNFLIYLVINAQWPVPDRDFIIRSDSTADWANGIVEIRLKSTDQFDYPPRKKRLRVQRFSATFRFEYISRNETRVTYITHSESGGKAPMALVAPINKKLTMTTVTALEKIAQSEIYMKRAMRDFN